MRRTASAAQSASVTMDDAVTAKETQTECLEYMKKGGHSPEERLDCFGKFDTTYPSFELIKEFYDLWSPDYDTDMKVAGYDNPLDVANEVEKLFPAEKRDALEILDVGAGTGEGGKKLSAKGFKLIDGTDGSPGMLTEAAKTGVYRKLHPAEILQKDQTIKSVGAETYDIVTCSGSIYPTHLRGYHLKCFVDCAKTGGHLVLSSCPDNDENVEVKPVVKELADQGVVEIVKEVYIPEWWGKEDGKLIVLKKLKRLNP